jgi:anti-sigma factor RsiW
MGITRNVILDLLPLYLDDEVSTDTRALIEKYLETDSELATAAQRLAKAKLPGDIPVPLTKEDEMEAYKEAKRLMFLRTVVIAITVSFVFLCTLAFMGTVWLAAFRFFQ